MASARKRFFCFGYGYTADYLGHELQTNHKGWTIGGTTRDTDRRNELLARPIADPKTLFGRFSHLLISTPPDDRGDPVFNMHAEDLINLPNLKWVGYLSSTGVYGNRNGGTVSESSEVSLDKPGHAFNRVHVDDIIQTLVASFKNPNPGQIYNLADDIPAPSHEVIAEACTLLNMPVPPLVPYEEADLAPIAQSFYKDNKHVLNDKIKQDLKINLKYPNYRDGLRGCLNAEEYFLKQLENKKA